MNYFEATQEAARLRAERTSHEIAIGVDYYVGCPRGGDIDHDCYVQRFGPTP